MSPQQGEEDPTRLYKSMPTTHKVTTSYKSPYPDPIKLRAGDTVAVFQKDTEWPGWLWCRSTIGKEGWVPEKYLRKIGNASPVTSARQMSTSDAYQAARDYDATELTVAKDELIELIYEESGWGWCRNKNGIEGWVPLNCLE